MALNIAAAWHGFECRQKTLHGFRSTDNRFEKARQSYEKKFFPLHKKNHAHTAEKYPTLIFFAFSLRKTYLS